LLQIAVDNDEKVSDITETVKQTLLETNTISSLDEIMESSITGPSIGEYITKTAKNALIWGMILMAFYILFAFAGMRELISPLLLGIVTIITMIFDVSIAAGAY
jgi:preprotein translocase subunit SecF